MPSSPSAQAFGHMDHECGHVESGLLVFAIPRGDLCAPCRVCIRSPFAGRAESEKLQSFTGGGKKGFFISGPSLVVPSSQYYLRSLSWTSRTFYFLDSRDLLEVLRGLSWQRERPLGRESLPCPHVRDLGKLVFCSQELTFAHIRSCPCRVCYGVVA